MDYLAKLPTIRDIGPGAFGLVRLCNDQVHGPVAVKFFFQAKFPDPTEWQLACDKALQEAKALRALEHRNVVRVHQVLQEPSQAEFLIVMEFCEGGSVRQLTKTNEIILSRAQRITRDAAIGLSYIHNQGFLHRDIKPDNILLDLQGEAKVADFGLVTDQLLAGLASAAGTPYYLAPEVADDFICSAISDVYSLGVTFLNLLHGDHWFLRTGTGEFFDTSGRFPKLSPKLLYLPHIPKSWRLSVGRLTRLSSLDRCQSMDAALNLVSRLQAVENWVCRVEPDRVTWTLEPSRGGRRVRVDWENYFRRGETWCAWTEDRTGQSKRTLERSNKGESSKETYRRLQAFFESRHKRQR